MLPFATISICLWLFRDMYLLSFVADISHSLHLRCQGHVGNSAQWSALYQALFCGASIYNQTYTSSLKNLGLVHLFVFSGAHLVFAETLIYRFTESQRKCFTLLLGLCLLSGFKAPALRALLQWSFRRLITAYELQWSPSLVVGMAGFSCLLLNPNWWQGLSLPLSWVATLSFTIAPTERKKLGLVYVYLLSLPLLWSLGPASPIAILINFLFSPLFFGVLFPLSWAAGAFPPLQTYIDPIWTLSFQVLDSLNLPLHFSQPEIGLSPFNKWLYVFGVQSLCYIKERQQLSLFSSGH